MTVQFEGGSEAPLGVYEITAEVGKGDRKISTPVIALSVSATESSGGRPGVTLSTERLDPTASGASAPRKAATSDR